MFFSYACICVVHNEQCGWKMQHMRITHTDTKQYLSSILCERTKDICYCCCLFISFLCLCFCLYSSKRAHIHSILHTACLPVLYYFQCLRLKAWRISPTNIFFTTWKQMNMYKMLCSNTVTVVKSKTKTKQNKKGKDVHPE